MSVLPLVALGPETACLRDEPSLLGDGAVPDYVDTDMVPEPMMGFSHEAQKQQFVKEVQRKLNGVSEELRKTQEELNKLNAAAEAKTQEVAEFSEVADAARLALEEATKKHEKVVAGLGKAKLDAEGELGKSKKELGKAKLDAEGKLGKSKRELQKLNSKKTELIEKIELITGQSKALDKQLQELN